MKKNIPLMGFEHKPKVVRLSAKTNQLIASKGLKKIVLENATVSAVWLDGNTMRGTVRLHKTDKPSVVYKHETGQCWVLSA